jgi:hypothetical protein
MGPFTGSDIALETGNRDIISSLSTVPGMQIKSVTAILFAISFLIPY